MRCARYIMRPWNGHHFNPQSGFSNGDEGSHWLAPGKMRSIATGGERVGANPRAPSPKARTEGPTGATIGSACGSAPKDMMSCSEPGVIYVIKHKSKSRESME